MYIVIIMMNIIVRHDWACVHTHTQNDNTECDFEMSIAEGWMEEKGSEEAKEIKSSYYMIARHSGSESWSVVSDSLWPHGLQSSWNSPDQNTVMDSLSLLQGIFPTQGSNPGFFALQMDSLPAEPQGKPKNPGVGGLSLLQQIFPTQESNWCLLHCRQILQQLSYEGSSYIFLKSYQFTHRKVLFY